MADNLFATYEQDFRDVYTSLETHLKTIPTLSNGMYTFILPLFSLCISKIDI